jgi:hypothetical protein
MKKQIIRTLFGLGLISLGIGAAMIGVTVAQYLRENFIFNPIMFMQILAGIAILIAANALGSKIIK